MFLCQLTENHLTICLFARIIKHWYKLCIYINIVIYLRPQLRTGNLFYNHSVPKTDPIHTHGTDWELYEKIEAKIKGCSCVIILAGVYSTYCKWINKEVEVAKKYNKPIIAVEYWGTERTSSVVKNAATTIVKWNAASIANAVRLYAIKQ